MEQQGMTAPGRVRRSVNDLVMAEMFLVQATIESAAAIGDGMGELGRKLTAFEASDAPGESFSALLQRIADQAVEPYTSRFRFLRDLHGSD